MIYNLFTYTIILNFQLLKISKQSIEILAIKNVLSYMEVNNLVKFWFGGKEKIKKWNVKLTQKGEK